jgi:Transglutaminase-like superfamily
MNRVSRIRNRLRRFGQVGNSRRIRLAEAALWLFLARVALMFVPFARIAGHLGHFGPPAAVPAHTLRAAASLSEVELATEISWAVTRAARYLPFKAVCLPQAIAAKAMLRRRRIDSVLHLGVAKDSQAHLQAHAWLDAAGVEVTGYPIRGEFIEIASFV